MSLSAVKQYLWNLVVNGVLMSYFVPCTFRMLCLSLSGCRIGGGSKIHGHSVLLSGRITIGRNSYVNRECLLDNASDEIIIGNNCAIACRVAIHTTNHDYSDSRKRAGKCVGAPVIIKDGCWIGSNVIILPGSVINEGVVVASGSVVKGVLRPNSVYAGVPAEIRKEL